MKITVPKSRVGQFFFFFATQCVSYFLVVANTRAYTHADIGWTAITDLLFAGQNFMVLALMVKDKEATGLWAGLGYTIGGTIGSLLSILVTKHVYGH